MLLKGKDKGDRRRVGGGNEEGRVRKEKKGGTEKREGYHGNFHYRGFIFSSLKSVIFFLFSNSFF